MFTGRRKHDNVHVYIIYSILLAEVFSLAWEQCMGRCMTILNSLLFLAVSVLLIIDRSELVYKVTVYKGL